MVTVSLYARVSSKKQAQENTIGSQIAELELRIDQDEHKLLDDYKFIDDGYSGSNLERPGLENLRDKVAEGKIDKVYIHSPDRLSRKSAYQVVLLEEFKKAGTEVIFLNHNFDDNPDSHLLLSIQGAIAEYERAKIMERNRRGKLYSAKKGNISVMSNAPYGYRYINKHIVEGGRFEINEDEAQIIRQMFTWVGEERASVREIARRLKEMSIKTQTGEGNWFPGAIHRMLKNPVYIGQAAYGKTKTGPALFRLRTKRKPRTQSVKNSSVYATDEKNWIYVSVPSIVDEGLFNAVQEQLVENKLRARVQKRKESFLLQGLAVCQCCKYGYHGIGGGSRRKIKYYYYRCAGSDPCRFNGSKICNNKLIRAEVLETAVWEEVKVLLKQPDSIMEEYQRRLSEDKDSKSSNKVLEKQENRLNRGIEKLIDSYAQGYITKEQFEPKVQAMNASLKVIKEQKEKMVDQKKLQQNMDIVTSSIKNFYSSFESKLDQLDWQAKRGVIRTLVKHIEIDLDKVDIVFRTQGLANFSQSRYNFNMQHCPRSQYA